MISKQDTEISWVDVVVICALPVEYRAISEKLKRHPESSMDVGLGFEHFLALEGGLTVLVVQLPDPGAGNVISGIVASLIIARYDPWLLISFGIAGTLDPGEIKALDVVYSQAVYYLDLRKETKSGRVLKRPVSRETPLSLLKLLRTLKVTGYGLHEVVLVTGEAVIKDEKASLRRIAGSAVGDAKAVEMESFGIYQAAEVDEKLLTRTKRLCVAIKGISDAADKSKSDEPHEIASRNAADFLFIALNSSGLPVLRKESGIEERPRPLQPFISRPPFEVKDLVDEFRKMIEPVVHTSWNRYTLQAVHMRWRYPRVFYHWRLTGMGLHWVEFKFLRVLRRLSDAGYPVECLVADILRPMKNVRLVEREIPEARKITREIVRALLPPRTGSPVTFYSEICQMETCLSQYAGRAGYSREVRDLLSKGDMGDLPSAPGSSVQSNLVFNEWLQYIAWRTRHEGVCIPFHHYSRQVYSLLSCFSGLHSALVPTGDLNLGGEWGKFESPGCELYLLPPNHPTIVQWLTATSDAGILAEFWTHLTEQEGFTESELVEKRQEWSRDCPPRVFPSGGDRAWVQQFLDRDERTAEYYKGAILLELAWLNGTFFSSFLAAPTG